MGSSHGLSGYDLCVRKTPRQFLLHDGLFANRNRWLGYLGTRLGQLVAVSLIETLFKQKLLSQQQQQQHRQEQRQTNTFRCHYTLYSKLY